MKKIDWRKARNALIAALALAAAGGGGYLAAEAKGRAQLRSERQRMREGVIKLLEQASRDHEQEIESLKAQHADATRDVRAAASKALFENKLFRRIVGEEAARDPAFRRRVEKAFPWRVLPSGKQRPKAPGKAQRKKAVPRGKGPYARFAYRM